MAFKAEELTTKIFPLLAAGGCPQDTASKGKPPCPQNTHPPCSGHTNSPPCNGPTFCPQDTVTGPPGKTTGPGKKSVAGLQGAELALLQAQLRDRLRQGAEASL